MAKLSGRAVFALRNQCTVIQLQPQHFVDSRRIARGDARIPVEHDPVVVGLHGRYREQFGDQPRHALDIGDKHRVPRFEVAFWLALQRRIHLFGGVHAARNQENLRLIIQGVGLVELIQQRPGRHALPHLNGLGPRRQKDQQQRQRKLHGRLLIVLA